MFRKGQHRMKDQNRLLLSENKFLTRQVSAATKRLRKAGELLKTETRQREMAEGILLQQTAALQQKNARIAELERLIEVSSEDTQQIPIVAEAPAASELAGVA
jgi:hypothetical protein